jgi:hypothetical protein
MEQQKESTVKIHWVSINDIMENPNNPRKISAAKIEELAASMREFPEMIQFRFMVVDRYTGHLLGGNQRYRASKLNGAKTIPVAYSDEMTGDQKREFIIRDNIEAGEWDEEKLNFEFKDFPLVSWGIIPGTPEPEKRQLDKSSVADDKIVYDNATIKQIVVYFDSETHARVSDELEKIREENNFGDNAEVLLFLMENYG